MLLVVILLALKVQYSSSTCPAPCSCYANIRFDGHRLDTLDCTDQGLTALPNNTANSQMMWLNGNNLGELTTDIFAQKGYQNASYILMPSAGVTKVHPFAFRGLNEIVRINLKSNNLTEILTNSFSFNFKKGKGDVNVEDNNISIVHPNAFDGLTGTADHRIFSGTFSKSLSIKFGKQRNQLKFKSSAFSGLKKANIIIDNVTELVIEAGAFNNSSVGISISNCKLTDLVTGTFTGLTNVTSLWFLNNVFSSINSGSFANVGFFMTGREREETTLFNLILFRDNKIGILGSRVFDGIVNSQIKFYDNTITTISNEPFYGLDTITLHFAVNALPLFPLNYITGLKTKEVYIRDNTPYLIARNNMSQAGNISKLTITYSDLHNVTIENSAFSGLHDIGTLTLEKINIPVLTTDLFTGLSRVDVLQIKNCGLKQIESSPFRSSQNITTLDLSYGTLLPCDCKTYSQVKSLEKVVGSVSMSCATDPANPSTSYKYHWRNVMRKCGSSSSVPSLWFHSSILSVTAAFIIIWKHYFPLFVCFDF